MILAVQPQSLQRRLFLSHTSPGCAEPCIGPMNLSRAPYAALLACITASAYCDTPFEFGHECVHVTAPFELDEDLGWFNGVAALEPSKALHEFDFWHAFAGLSAWCAVPVHDEHFPDKDLCFEYPTHIQVGRPDAHSSRLFKLCVLGDAEPVRLLVQLLGVVDQLALVQVVARVLLRGVQRRVQLSLRRFR